MLFGEIEPGEEYFYHYTRASTLPLILESQRLRMGSYLNTNDPKESKQWTPALSLHEDDDISTEEFFDLLRSLDARIRQRTKVLCFTLDRPSQSSAYTLHHRGWARARMWSQYGDQHAGACLVFRSRAVGDAVRAEVGTAIAGPVAYADVPVGPLGYFSFSADELRREGGLDDAADRAIEDWSRSLFLTKAVDWMTESEYRYVAHTDSEFVEIPISGSLAAVVLGQDHPPTELESIQRLVRNYPNKVTVARCLWQNGSPQALPAE